MSATKSDAFAAGNTRRHENYFSYNELRSRAIDVDRIATDEYYRVRKEYNDVDSHPYYHKNAYHSKFHSKRRPKSEKRSKRKIKFPIRNHNCLSPDDLHTVYKLMTQN